MHGTGISIGISNWMARNSPWISSSQLLASHSFDVGNNNTCIAAACVIWDSVIFERMYFNWACPGFGTLPKKVFAQRIYHIRPSAICMKFNMLVLYVTINHVWVSSHMKSVSIGMCIARCIRSSQLPSFCWHEVVIAVGQSCVTIYFASADYQLKEVN